MQSGQWKLRMNLQLDDVGVKRAFSVIEQLPRNDPLTGVAATLQEFDRHNLPCLCVFCQLNEAGSSSAFATMNASLKRTLRWLYSQKTLTVVSSWHSLSRDGSFSQPTCAIGRYDGLAC